MMKCVSQVHVSGYVNNKMKIFWGVDKLGVENATSWWRGRHVTQPSLPYHPSGGSKTPSLSNRPPSTPKIQIRRPDNNHTRIGRPAYPSRARASSSASSSAFSSPNTWLQVAEHYLALTDGPRTSLQSAPRHATTTKLEHES